MAQKLNFYKLIWDEANFRGLRTDGNFKEFILQIVNQDVTTGNRDFFGLIVYGRDNSDNNYPIPPATIIPPDSLITTKISPKFVPVSDKILMGSIKMKKRDLYDVTPTKKPFKYLKFEADKTAKDYIKYIVYAVDDQEDPVTYEDDPLEIYDHEIDFTHTHNIFEKKFRTGKYVAVEVNPNPPPP